MIMTIAATVMMMVMVLDRINGKNKNQKLKTKCCRDEDADRISHNRDS